jgi:Glycosyl transferases group 1
VQNLRSNLVPVRFGSSNWVDHRLFRPLPGVEKVYDAVYVTNYKVIKRTHRYLQAVRRQRDGRYRAALVCSSWGDARSDVVGLLDVYGLRGTVDLYEDLPATRLNEVLNQCRVNVLLSYREGSNRSLFESFFADVPGIALAENVGMNKEYVNAETGLLIQNRELEDALAYFRNSPAGFHPRAWAMEHISPEATTRELSAVLTRLAAERGELFTPDLVPKINAPEVQHMHERDRAALPDPRSFLPLFALDAKADRLRIEAALFASTSEVASGSSH